MELWINGSFLFLDWCPATSGVSLRRLGRVHSFDTNDTDNDFCTSLSRSADVNVTSIEAIRRDDGFMLIFLTVPNWQSFSDIRDLARRASTRIKQDVFGHKHVHHTLSTGGGIREETAEVLYNHHPVPCFPTGKGNHPSEGKNRKYNENMGKTERIEFLQNCLRDDSGLCELKAVMGPGFSESERLAAVELKDALGGRYHDAISTVQGLKSGYWRRRKQTLIEAIIIFAIFFFSYLNTSETVAAGLEKKIVLTKGVLLSLIPPTIYFVYRVDYQLSDRILAEVQQALGFLHRASTYCNRISNIYRSNGDCPSASNVTHTTNDTFAGFIGSLESIGATTKSRMEQRLIAAGIFVSFAGILTSVL